MKPEVFVVLLVSLSGTVSEGNPNASNQVTPIQHISNEILGKNSGWKNPDDDDETPDKSTKGDPTKDYRYDYYYGHMIDQCLERLKQNNQEYSIEARIKLLEPHRSEMPVEGTIKFDGMHSLGLDMTRVKRFENGDRDLLATFELGNISGTGIFSGLNNVKESTNDVFHFHPSPTNIQVFFMMTKDPSRKRVAFKFAEPLRLHYDMNDDEIRKDINVTLLLEQKASIVFNRLFNDLYNIIYERLFLTARIASPHFDTVLDKIFNNFSRAEPLTLGGQSHSEESITENSLGDGFTFSRVRGSGKMTWWKLSSNILHSLTRMSNVQVLNEMNGGHELQTTIKFGNLSGNGSIFYRTPEVTIHEFFSFTSPPVVGEAFLCPPRNKSFEKASKFNFLTKPNYTIQLQNESFRNTFQLILKRGLSMFPAAVNYILDEIHAHNLGPTVPTV